MTERNRKKEEPSTPKETPQLKTEMKHEDNRSLSGRNFYQSVTAVVDARRSKRLKRLPATPAQPDTNLAQKTNKESHNKMQHKPK